MASTYEPIASHTLSSDAATYTFTSIPSTYTDLLLVTSIKRQTASSPAYIQVNSDTGTNYSSVSLVGTGSSAISGLAPNAVRVSIDYTTSTSEFTFGRSHLMSYANTSVYKTILTEYASPSSRVVRQVSTWRDTSAINSILIGIQNGSNIITGSTLALFGIKAA